MTALLTLRSRVVAAVSVSVLALSGLVACSPGEPVESTNGSSAPPTSGPDESDLVEADVKYHRVPLEDATEADSVIRQTRALGLQILESLHGQTVVTSPASTVVALSMLASGAEGETEDEFAVILGASTEQRNQAVDALVGSLAPYATAPSEVDLEDLPEEPQMHMANQVVADDGLEIQEPYLDSLKKWFDAGVLTTDLQGQEGSRVLDDWVSDNTADLVRKSAIEITEDTRLVLQNAILLAASWTSPFLEGATQPAEFHRLDGTQLEAEFMNSTLTTQYAELDEWKMLELPYGEDGDLVARYVMGPADLAISKVQASVLAELESTLEPLSVAVSIPKLDLTSTASLVAPLQQHGLTAIFSAQPSALGYISNSADLVVDQIVQQGRLMLNEAGTAAAAVTEVGVAVTSAPVAEAEFVADRPHIILIQDRNVGWDLFQVLVNDPQQ